MDAAQGAEGNDTGTSDGESDPLSILDESDEAPPGGVVECVVEEPPQLVSRSPVDVILVLDNSDSMAEELGAVERNLNESFAQILDGSGTDYRLIVISRHRDRPREDLPQTVCIQAPLSGVEDCEEAGEPVFGEHFFQYSARIGSGNSLEVLLDTFEPPFENSLVTDPFGNAERGWSEWVRPGAQKVILEMTDDDSRLDADTFVTRFTGLDGALFGTSDAPSFTFHSVVGLREKLRATEPYAPGEPLSSETCGSPDDVASPGLVYQELSRRTGGLRFPLCEFDSYDVVFQAIADSVLVNSGLPCDVPVPEAPAGRSLDTDTITVTLLDEAGRENSLGQAGSGSACQSNAFYVADGVVHLCPETCAAGRGASGTRLQVGVGCESSLIR